MKMESAKGDSIELLRESGALLERVSPNAAAGFGPSAAAHPARAGRVGRDTPAARSTRQRVALDGTPLRLQLIGETRPAPRGAA